ncbi:MAG: SURF1 family protein [Paracoccaceae bacterium]
MRRSMVAPLLFGIAGVGLLIWLGSWQLQRLGWKQDVLAGIDTQIAAAPVALPSGPDPERDGFLSVVATGVFGPREIHVLASNRDTGAGYRVIAVFTTAGRRVLVDRGFMPIAAKDDLRLVRQITIGGNLHWPDEIDKYTPEPDIGKKIWFARDVSALAAALGTEPLLIVANTDTGDGISVFPVNTATIPNNHLNYAITWFLLAVVWFGMTVFLLSRIKRQSQP